MSGIYEVVLGNLIEFGIPITLSHGETRQRLVGFSVTHDLREGGFPLITTKPMDFDAIKRKLFQDIQIWRNWQEYQVTTTETFNEMYKQGYRYCGDFSRFLEAPPRPLFVRDTDQIARVLWNIKENPYKGRMTIMQGSMVDAEDAPVLQFIPLPDRHLVHLMVFVPGIDWFNEGPEAIARYAMLLLMVCQSLGHQAGSVMMLVSQGYISEKDLPKAKAQIEREVRPNPILYTVPEIRSFDAFTPSSLWLAEYNPHPPL